MQIIASELREFGINFAVVQVASYVIRSSSESEKAIAALQYSFRGQPVVLVGQDGRNIVYRGRQDIVDCMKHVHPSRIPWSKYTVN